MDPTLEEILSKHELQPNEMSSRCSHSVRKRMAKQLVDWKMIGHYLRFTQVQIHAIHVENETGEERRMALLDAWAEKDGGGATYLKLAEALYAHGRRDLVEQLCKMINRALRSDMSLTDKPPSEIKCCLLYTSPSPRDATLSRMPSSA